MLPIRYLFTPANASLTGFASNVTGATWTLTASAATDSLAHRVSIRNDTANSHAGKTALLTGTDQDGLPQTETITLPAGNATVESTKYFKTLTSVVPSATIGADTMDIGWVDEFVSPTIGLDRNAGIVGVNTIVTGTISYTVQQTFNDIQTLTRSSINWMNNDDTALVNATVNTNGNYIASVIATRVVINSYSSGATLGFNVTQRYQ